jgi:hypothetical protein
MTPEQLRELAQVWLSFARQAVLRRGSGQRMAAERAYWTGVEYTLRLFGKTLGDDHWLILTQGRSLADLLTQRP